MAIIDLDQARQRPRRSSAYREPTRPRVHGLRHPGRRRTARSVERRLALFTACCAALLVGNLFATQQNDAGASGRFDYIGQPNRVVDGDTLRIGMTRIRLHGVDAPEMPTPDGVHARQHLMRLMTGGPVRCRDTGERTYDRIVARCFAADGRDLSRAMAEDGWAEPMWSFGGAGHTWAWMRAVWARRGMYSD